MPKSIRIRRPALREWRQRRRTERRQSRLRKAQRRQDERVALYGRDEHTGGYGDPPV